MCIINRVFPVCMNFLLGCLAEMKHHLLAVLYLGHGISGGFNPLPVAQPALEIETHPNAKFFCGVLSASCWQ